MPIGSPELQPAGFRALLLFLFTLGNYALMYLANILLARSLTVHDFDDYSVALSMVTLLSTLATLGLEKYALRAIALFRDRQDWGKFRGFWLFSIRIITGFSLLLIIVLSVALELILAIRHADYHEAIVIYAGFLPVIALTLFLVEIISAQGYQILSIGIYRLFLPLVYLSIIGALSLHGVNLSATIAVLSYGAAWVLTFTSIWYAANLIIKEEIKSAKPLILPRKWLSRSLSLVFSSLLMTVMTSGGVIMLELLYPSGVEVGIYAVAAQTGGFISLIGTSTNRYYLPYLVVLVEKNDKTQIQQLIRQRMLALGVLILGLFNVIAWFGHSILSLFGETFNAGYMTLVIISAGASFSGLFADMPYTLQYMGYNRTVVGLTFLAVVIMIFLGFYLGESHGTVGMAIAYALPVTLLFLGFRILQHFLIKNYNL